MQDIIKTLAWTFIHSLWQGLIVALLAAIIIGSTRIAAARLRYNLLGILMLFFLITSFTTFIIQWRVGIRPVAVTSFGIIKDTPAMNSTNDLMANFINWINANSDTVILVWAFFFLFSCFRLITGLAAVSRLKSHKTHPVIAEWRTKLVQLQLVIGVRNSVTLLQSELIKVPMALGILKPVILVPLGLLTHLPAEQVETILLHELAHIRRRDYLTNLLQHIAEAIFFFNPAIRWLSSLIRQEREACCDDMVVATDNQKNNYLNALVSFQEYSLGQSSYAMGISCKRHYLLNRVKRMLTNKNQGVNFFEKTALFAGVLLFSAFSFIAQQKKEVETTPAIVQQSPAVVLPIVAAKREQPSIKKRKKKISRLNKPVTNILSVKKDTVPDRNNISTNMPLPNLNAGEQPTTAADAKLQEIVKIKNQIGDKKEIIGRKKQQLNTTDEKEKQKILNEINRERQEIEGKRNELNIKRAEWDHLKKQALREKEHENNAEIKKVTEKENMAEIRHENDKRVQLFKPSPISPKQKMNLFNKERSTIFRQELQYKIRQELQYKIDLQIKNPPTAKPKAEPLKMKTPESAGRTIVH